MGRLDTTLHKKLDSGITETIKFLDGCYIYSRYNPDGRTETITETYQYNGKNRLSLIEEYRSLGFYYQEELRVKQ